MTKEKPTEVCDFPVGTLLHVEGLGKVTRLTNGLIYPRISVRGKEVTISRHALATRYDWVKHYKRMLDKGLIHEGEYNSAISFHTK